MKLFTCILFYLVVIFSSEAQEVLLYGNKLSLASSDTLLKFEYVENLPVDLDSYEAIMIFSSAHSRLTLKEEDQIELYVRSGGSLYLGADNWPLVHECNQLTKRFFQSRCYGYFEGDTLHLSDESSFKPLGIDERFAGTTTVSFPMNYALVVEAWSADNPIIMSGQLGAGRIILDGGYSRFYRTDRSQALLEQILKLLLK